MAAPVAAVAARPRAGGLDIAVTWKRPCSFTGDRILEQRIETGATVDFYGPDSCTGECGILYVFSIIAAPITLGVSGIVTGIKVARTDDRFVTKVQPLPLRHGTCEEAGANVDVVILSPGSEPRRATTDAAGRARIELADDTAAAQARVELAR